MANLCSAWAQFLCFLTFERVTDIFTLQSICWSIINVNFQKITPEPFTTLTGFISRSRSLTSFCSCVAINKTQTSVHFQHIFFICYVTACRTLCDVFTPAMTTLFWSRAFYPQRKVFCSVQTCKGQTCHGSFWDVGSLDALQLSNKANTSEENYCDLEAGSLFPQRVTLC